MEAVIKFPTEVKIKATSRFRRLPKLLVTLGIACLVAWGVGFSKNHERAMFSYLFAFISVLSISLGCMVFVLIQHVTRAGWSVAVRRVPEAAMAAMPLFLLLFIPIAVQVDALFPWTKIDPNDTILIEKAPYLNVSFFYVRSFIYLGSWTAMGLWFHKISVSQDGGKNRANTKKLWAMSAPCIIIFALTTSFASFDWLMSMQPHWFSTIFGVYFFSGNLLAGLAFIVLVYVGLQKYGLLEKGVVNQEHYHDMGKLIFGFTIFWAYIAFSQFMIYWYGGIPEETEFFLQRLHNGWEWVSYALPLTNFVIPFIVLLSRHAKRNVGVLVASCIWIMVFHFVDIFWLVLPNFGAHHAGSAVPQLAVSWMDLICVIGMASLFSAYVAFLVKKSDVIPSGDSRLHESLAFENF